MSLMEWFIGSDPFFYHWPNWLLEQVHLSCYVRSQTVAASTRMCRVELSMVYYATRHIIFPDNLLTVEAKEHNTLTTSIITALQSSLPCNHHCPAIIAALQSSLPCNHHRLAIITALQSSPPCNHHCPAIITALLQSSLPCNHRCPAIITALLS